MLIVNSDMFTSRIINLARLNVGFRALSTSRPTLNAQKSPLFQLRRKTGLAYNLCREALEKHDNDVDRAEVWLQAQALAHGLQKATKVGNRNTKEGLVSLAVSQDNKSLTMLELNCETDFVAKNQIFKDFTIELTEQVANSKDGFSAHQSYANSTIEEYLANADTMSSISNQIAPLLTKLGENIRLHKVSHFISNCNQTRLYGQIHAQASHKRSDNLDIFAGRFGAIVALRFQGSSEGSSKAIGNRLCHHVIGYSPTYIELPDELRKSLEEAEREKAQAQAELIRDNEHDEDRDPDELRLDNNNNSRDEWPSIMDQQLIMSDDQSVRDFCKENQMAIVHFQRFECGVGS